MLPVIRSGFGIFGSMMHHVKPGFVVMAGVRHMVRHLQLLRGNLVQFQVSSKDEVRSITCLSRLFSKCNAAAQVQLALGH